MAESFNESVRKLMIANQLDVLRGAKIVTDSALKHIATLERTLLALLATENPSAPARLSSRRLAVEKLLKVFRPLLTQAYRTIEVDTGAALADVSLASIQSLVDAVNVEAGVPLLIQPIGTDTIVTTLSTTPIPSIATPTASSTTLPEWWRRQALRLGQNVSDTLLQGVRREEPLEQLVDRLRGVDGVLPLAERHAESLTRTALSMSVHQYRETLWDANRDIMNGIMHLSTLDRRTSHICMARDGKRYTLPGHKPIGHTLPYLDGIPYHWQCRSTFQPLFVSHEDMLGVRGRRFDAALKALPEGKRASMNGLIPQPQSFDAWLKILTERDQKRLLGTARWQLWVNGKITVDHLLDQVTGRPLRVSELQNIPA